MIRRLIVAALVLLTAGCGWYDNVRECYDGCESEDQPAPEITIVRGEPGPRGATGRTGTAGTTGQQGPTGPTGADGAAGPSGPTGPAGHAAVFAALDADPADCPTGGHILLSAADQDDDGTLTTADVPVLSTVVCNGATGPTGPTGADGAPAPVQPYSVTAVLDPCGDAPGRIDEVLLQLASGALLASFSDDVGGTNTRFALLGPGSYSTTDGSLCAFTVSPTGVVTW
jgi:hypothetical protein